ncbi:MAG: hypothetical protein M0Z48_01810 [Nitrospiraceae bacterium]|nr:hypothetical protein [Nitrospiraceae bacterium]
MRKYKDMLWTWIMPDAPRAAGMDEWRRHGGKWIVFDRKENTEELARGLAPFIENGEIEGAKYWNEDPGAICVYSLDRDRGRVSGILDELGAGGSRVWEYDYAWDKNIRRPLDFAFSWSAKFRTILQSYGFAGALRLLREVLKTRKDLNG